jgi:hypothetical protein
MTMTENVIRITIELVETGERRAYARRDAWTLAALIAANDRGVTPIERPAPRWSEYVRRLRRSGLIIETMTEAHGGPYRGHHGRYVLRTVVKVIAMERAANDNAPR